MHLRLFRIGLILGCLPLAGLPWLPTRPALAQTTPLPPSLPRDRILIIPEPEPPVPKLPDLKEILPGDSPVPATPRPMACNPPKILVKGFTFVVSKDRKIDPNGKITAFSPAELQREVAALTGKKLTCAELTAVAQRITQKYVDAGYINSGAIVPDVQPEGTMQTGFVVPIAISEGQLEPIRVCFIAPPRRADPPVSRPCEHLARHRLRERYVSDRITAAGRPFNRNRLLDALKLLKLNPLIQDIRAQIAPSSKSGYSILTLEVIEAKSLSAEVLLDNGRSPSVGSFRRQIQATQGNLTGGGDSLSLAYANTSGSNTGTINYTLPLNPRGGTLSFNLGLAGSHIVEKPFSVLDIEASSQSYDLTYRQPLVLRPEREFALSIIGSHRVSQATLLNGLVPFPSIGAEADGKTRLTALRFVQEAIWRSPVEIIGLRSQFSLGLGFLNATANDFSPDSRFVSWLGQAQWARNTRLGLLVVKADLQFSDRPLLPNEQFGLGGQSNVRGYRQDALLTDGGVFASAELRIPVVRTYQSQFQLDAVPFLDFGHGWNHPSVYGAPLTTDTLLSTGLGLRAELGDRLLARLDWGIPLIKLPTPVFGQGRTLQEEGVYFSAIYQF